MTTLTKDFYRHELNYARRRLEDFFEMFSLNETQKQKIRYEIDNMIEHQRREYNAPERQADD